MFSDFIKVEVQTPRLILRPMNTNDTECIIRWRNLEHVSSNSINNSQVFTAERHLQWFVETRNSRIDYIVELREKKIPIGSLSFQHHFNTKEQRGALISKYIGEPEYLGKGIGKEMTYHWLKFGFNALKLDYVVAIVKSSNYANITLNKFLGFAILDNVPQSFAAQVLPPGFIIMFLSSRDFNCDA